MDVDLVLAELDRLDLARNTIVVLWAPLEIAERSAGNLLPVPWLESAVLMAFR